MQAGPHDLPIAMCGSKRTPRRFGRIVSASVPDATHGPVWAASRHALDVLFTKAFLFTAQNALIQRLPRIEQRRLLKRCEPVDLVFAAMLGAPGQQTAHAYFPVNGYVSLLQQTGAQAPLEVGMVGREGMLGAELALGVTTTPLLALVRGSGAAWRIEQSALQEALAQSPALRQGLHRYVYVLLAQRAAAVSCQRFHLIEARLARQLLMSQDRAHADTFHVTHEDLAQMLGVRRVGVTVAAGELQRSGLIAYHRGDLRVVNRIALQSRACSCYALDQRIYDASMQDKAGERADRDFA